MSWTNKRTILLTESPYQRILRMRKKRFNKRHKTNTIFLERSEYGEFHHLYEKLRTCPRGPALFRGYSRMLPETFDYIVKAISPVMKYSETNFQRPISVPERLMLTLRYLATGIQFRQLQYSFRISKTTVATIIIEVCKAIWKTLLKNHMPQPTTEDFRKIAADFWIRWQFPNCMGCLDGKHIRIKRPPKSGSMYYCYKNFFSIGLLALTDANYKFIMVNVGSYGKDSDAGVFEDCPLRQAIENGSIIIPEETSLPGSTITTPYVFLGDEAFPLTEYLMRPFPRAQLQEGDEYDMFNYRLCSARMVVECSFGAIASKCRILLKAIETNVENAVHIVKAITLLHNMIKDLEGISEMDLVNYRNVRIDPRSYMQPKRKHNAYTKKAAFVRKKFSRFFTLRPLSHE